MNDLNAVLIEGKLSFVFKAFRRGYTGEPEKDPYIRAELRSQRFWKDDEDEYHKEINIFPVYFPKKIQKKYDMEKFKENAKVRIVGHLRSSGFPWIEIEHIEYIRG